MSRSHIPLGSDVELRKAIESETRHLLGPAEILHLDTAPVEVVPAPGDDAVLVPTFLMLVYRFVSAPYDYDPGAFLAYANNPGGAITGGSFGDLVTKTVDFVAWQVIHVDGGSPFPPDESAMVGQALVLAYRPDSLDPGVAPGDGTLDVIVRYTAATGL